MIKLRKFDTPYPNPHDYGNWRSCPGIERIAKPDFIARDQHEDKGKYSNRLVYCSKTDLAWIVCLYKAGVLSREDSATVLNGLKKRLASDEYGFGGERDLIPTLDNNEDLASLINLGRTMQEPMSRLQMRDQLVDFFDYYFELMDLVADFIEENAETIMPGHTHFSQANPITLANYYLSIFDNLARGLEQLELSYKLINKNSGGCGATSGTVWPVDRNYLTRLLGLDELLEVTYDCEASQDHTIHLLFSLSNIVTLFSRATMDIEIWGLEEIDMIRMDRSCAGVSSMMPQKSHNGELTEPLRNSICDILGQLNVGLFRTKSEPHGDVLAMYSLPNIGINTLADSKAVIRKFGVILDNVHPQKEKMLEYVTNGYSCMTELVVYMVKELGYGGRRAHRICANMVRIARDRNINAPDITGAMLDEAAALCEEEAPHIDTANIQKCLDPINFIKSHNNIGGPAPSETMRMLKQRRELIDSARKKQQERKQRILDGQELLENEIKNICE
jgi:argininosuccinate lyase